MTQSSPSSTPENDLCVLVMMPIGRDATLVVDALHGVGLKTEICRDLDDLAIRTQRGAGAILLAEEALAGRDLNGLIGVINQQPVWSDLPVVLLSMTSGSPERLAAYVGSALNITILERPIQKAVLISALKGALRARRRQYQTRDLLTELKEADRQKDEFLATLSHELRTPLNSMLGWIQMLKTERNGFDKQHAMEVIERNARAQTQIINDILTLSRVVTGKLEFDLRSIDLSEVIASAVDVVKPQVELKRILLSFEPSNVPCPVRGDFDRLQQVFWNLLSNAIKFTPEFGRVTICPCIDGDQVTVTVSDTGKGILPEFLPFAFERFRQADSSFTRQVGGLGLGLAIVRTLVEQHGGSVHAESGGEDKGATFTVRLPLEATVQDAAGPANLGDTLPLSINSIRILLAEDDDDAREMLAILLRQSDIEVEAVATANEAIAALARNLPTILISDVGMPDLDGYAMIEKIRRLPPEQGGEVPAIALTGYAGAQDRARSIRAGYQAHLSKPIDFTELFETIDRLRSNGTLQVLPSGTLHL